MRKVIGIDLGGTNIRAGVVFNGELVKVRKSSFNSEASTEKIIEIIFSMVNDIIDPEIDAIGFGVPSVVDTKAGIVYDTFNIPSWKRVEVKSVFEKKYSLPVFINNDANCFVLGEKFFGKGQSAESLIGLTIGTGLGAGIIINNKLYEGFNCGAGEFGIIPYKDQIIEYYCSGQFFTNCYNVSGERLAAKGRAGNKEAIKIYSLFGSNLGEALKIILSSYDPQKIIIGGSVSRSYPLFRKSLWQSLKKFPYPNTIKNLKIEISELKYPGILGAATLANI